LTEQEIEAIMVFPLFTEPEIHMEMMYLFLVVCALYLVQFVGISIQINYINDVF